MRLYPYIAPLILGPLSFVLWRREYEGNLLLISTAWLIPVLWAYIVPGIGTNVLKVWEFDTRLRLGRFRPHHGFVFGSATATLAWLVHGSGVLRNAIAMCVVIGVVNVLYDIKALRAGILRVYNQPWAEGGDAKAIAMDYAPWCFGGFGFVYGAGIGVMERSPSVSVFAGTLVLSMVVPVALYSVQSKWRHGHWGMLPLPAAVRSRTVSGDGDEKEPLSIALSPRGGERGVGLETLNWLILIASMVATSACLWLASHAPSWIALLACIAFAFVNNVPFALMHEAVHGAASNALGFVASCMFPTSFSLQRVAHMGHHARNRTDEDLYDYYLPTQSRFVRNVWLYAGNLLGLYWFCIPVSNALYLVGTPFYRSRVFIEKIAPAIGFGPHVRDIAQLPPLRVWIEILCAFAYQAGLWWLLDLDWRGWLLAHWLFAMHWSALQYVDHAWSRRDVAHGAWNLRVFAPVRWLALNYHYHHAHHNHPTAPWTELPALARAETTEAEPSFWQIYVSLWRHGVQPAPPMGSPAQRSLFAPAEQKT